MSTELMVAVITAVTTSILGPIAVHYFKMMVEKKKKDPLADSIEANQLITDKLEEVKNKEHADRIWILQFHNGGNYYPTGKSIQKFSMVYEMLGQGIIPCQHQLQNIPVSLFSIENKQFEGFTSVIPGAGVKSTYLFPVYTIKNEFVAIVGIDYVSKKKNLTNQEINDIDLELSTIGGVLNNYLQV
jgi:hypothetical protein